MTTRALEVKDDMSLGELGNVFVKSGFFQDTREASQAVVKILAGRELGFGPMAAMTGVYIVKGRVSLSANLMAAALKRSGKYNYRVLEHTDQACEIAFFEQGQEIGRSRFTVADAKKAGTQNMDRYPRNMLFARAMSNGVKWYCADVFGGPVYTPEEMGAKVDDDGDVVEMPMVDAVAPTAADQIGPGPDFDQSAKPTQPANPPAASKAAAQSTAKAPARPSQAMWDKFDDLVAEAKKLGIKAPDYDVAEISATDLAALGHSLRALVNQTLEQQAAQAARGTAAPEPDTSEETETKPAAAKAAADGPELPKDALRKRFDAVAKVACQVLGFEAIYVPANITAAQLTEMGTVIKQQTDLVKAAHGADGRLFAIAMAKLVITAYEARWRGIIGAGWTPSPQWKQSDLVSQFSQLTRKIEDAKVKEKRDVREPVAA